MKRLLYTILLFPAAAGLLFPDTDLSLQPEDFQIIQTLEGGYHLWIRKKPAIGSVLLTESSADPAKRLHSYTLRNPGYHPANGDERRILDGEFLKQNELFFLMDSTPERHSELGKAFHIFIPYIVIYGYPSRRSGEIQVLDGTFLNIRSFAKPYADYSGVYLDNPFMLRVRQLLLAEPEGEFMDAAVESFSGIAGESGGTALRSSGKEDLVGRIGDIIDGAGGLSLDLVLALDTTQSMHNDMPALKKQIVPLIREHTARFERFRLGLLYYRDYREQYLVKPLPFETDLAAIQRSIDHVRVLGGRDIPEAVFEALYNAVNLYDWQADSRLVVLIGDAPPHPKPRGKVTKEMVYQDAREKGILINTIILPQ